MNISPLVKNNKTLIIVLGVTFVCACVMIIECLSVYGHIQEIMDKIVEEDAEIQRINGGKNPNPVKASEKIIQANTEQYRLRIRDIRRRIGNPYREALKEFLRNLESVEFLRNAPLPAVKYVDVRGASAKTGPAAGAAASDKEPVTLKYTEDEIRSAFVDLYNSYYSDRKNDADDSFSDNDRLVGEHEALFDKFRDKLVQPPESKEFSSEEERKAYLTGALQSFDKAFYEFCHQVKKNTIEGEGIQWENVNDLKEALRDAKFIFLESLGLPRTMTSLNCKAFADEISNNIRKNPSLIPGLALWTKSANRGKDTSIDGRIKALTYDHKGQNPAPVNVVHILRHYQILQDLFRRMRGSKIQNLESLSSPFSETPTGDLSGETYREMGADYKKFIYEVTLISTGGEIRDFINSLHRAFEQNIVYDIQKIKFHKEPRFDAVKSASEKVDALRKSAEKGIDGKDAQRKLGTEGAETAEGSASADSRTPEEIYADPGYGNTLLGQDELVKVEIRFNYIVYVGEMLGKK